jgi:hypothetical protein
MKNYLKYASALLLTENLAVAIYVPEGNQIIDSKINNVL